MNGAITIGVYITKSVFQVHAVDAAGEPVVRLQLAQTDIVDYWQNTLSL